MVKSFAVWPLEFLLSKLTPNWRNDLKIYGAAPAAANITLLFPEQSTSSQWRPALINIYTISRWFLKLAQCKGFGLNYLVEPIATCLFYCFIYKYCCPAPLDKRSFTIGVYPEQHAQISAFHFFFVFSIYHINKKYLNNWCQPFF